MAALTIRGRAAIAGDASATGRLTVSGRATVGGAVSSDAPTRAMTSVRAVDYRQRADSVLTRDGRLTDLAEVTVCDASARANACRNRGYMWVFRGEAGWHLRTVGGLGNAKTYYVETGATVRVPGGISAGRRRRRLRVPAGDAPLVITVIAEGDITLRGRGTITANTPGLLFVTDQDLRVRGRVEQIGDEARILVREQLSITGRSTLAGPLVAENAAAISQTVRATTIAGDATITNTGKLGERVAFEVRGWREVREQRTGQSPTQ